MGEPAWTWTTDERLPSRLGASDPFVQSLLTQLGEHAWNEHDVFAIRLAVEEALVNAIRHGNQLDETKQVRVTCKVSQESVWVEIVDEGPGFNPDDLPDPTAPENLERPSGRGVMLMRSFMTHVEYHDQGNRVVMEKHKANGRAS
jgi:serine/threonine-protein kinase RsbW